MNRIKQQAPAIIFKKDVLPNFQNQVENGQLEKPLATATLEFDNGHHTQAEQFVVMKDLTGPIIGLQFLRRNSVVIDTTHILVHFPQMTLQVKSAASEVSVEPQVVFIDDALPIPPMTTKTITGFADHPSELNTTATVKPSDRSTGAPNLMISHSMSTKTDK